MANPTEAYRVYWRIFFLPASPSLFWRSCNFGYICARSWNTICALMKGTIPREHIPSLPMPPPEKESKVLNKLFWSKFPRKASLFTPPRGIYIPSRDKARYPKSLRNFPGNGPLKKSPKSMELSSIAAGNSKCLNQLLKATDINCNLKIFRKKKNWSQETNLPLLEQR